jgi:hypothetical protein
MRLLSTGTDYETIQTDYKLDCSPLWSSGQSSCLQIQRSGFDSRHYQIFWEIVVLERGPLSLVSTIEVLLQSKSSGSGLDNRDYGRRDPSLKPSGALYPWKLALTSLTSSGLWVGIVRSRTQVTWFTCQQKRENLRPTLYPYRYRGPHTPPLARMRGDVPPSPTPPTYLPILRQHCLWHETQCYSCRNKADMELVPLLSGPRCSTTQRRAGLGSICVLLHRTVRKRNKNIEASSSDSSIHTHTRARARTHTHTHTHTWAARSTITWLIHESFTKSSNYTPQLLLLSAHAVYLRVPYDSHDKQRLFPPNSINRFVSVAET